ncbi:MULTISPECIES: ABC transporter substrate-binding protein [unclassified Mesorhizobium]|uniref:ABC transporter substrate-binding protein n=1 Tax=unclassified Mesorhizobium TaxID=325217 RepID=UPI0013E37752|nr:MULTISPECIES: ABC transporter substrate-binding protein [unclassified Mesorhizobium]MCT2581260.1 ABC transporter substrate-binding protein [Mesorhizobium sp. P13.3]MDF3170345.1 ABC transporter substrate-binding protein [Mesorhizobium sp. P16.1]MDF3181400.1 ABC transporter substrate-binding protein [Mesorhizobium sp. P17.1]MDF3187173.1 ABC transporter substrate-binding protein [Mesorhizobium sp. ICCV3110.1]
MNKSISTVSRRTFLAGMTGVLAAPVVLRTSRAAADSGSLTFTGYGGSYQDAVVKNVVNPFTEETGIKVNVVPAPDLARVKAQQLTGNIEWDVFDGSSTEGATGSKQDLWEKLDLSMFDAGDLATAPNEDFIPWGLYTGGIAWDPNKFGPGKHPSTFAELFDLEKFPGRRTLFLNAPSWNLEIALLADGVPPKDIYPLDLDRAFKMLDRIKPSIPSWPPTSTQTISLVQNGEVDFCCTFANRVKATNEPGGGLPLAFSFEQNLLDAEVLTVLKGAPNKANAMKFVAYCVRPEVQARLNNQLGGTPVSKKARPMLSAEVRKWQPDFDSPVNLFIDVPYWTDNSEAVTARFKEWMLS